ncbi:MAG: hypothetical protein JO161_05090 [Planctomycetaceae bacterium]|nr:hypothetical protein [Planctomycetaceae bacterium]
MADEVASGSAYEFNHAQESQIAELGRAMRIVGLFAIFYAVAGIALMAFAAWKTRVLAIDLGPILSIFLGIWAMAGGSSFLQVAATQGHDIDHLMTALGKLKNIFRLIAILMVAALLITVTIAVIVLFFRPAGSALVVQGHPVG